MRYSSTWLRPVPVVLPGKLGAGLEIRVYSPYVVAEVQEAGDGSEDDRFRTLAKVCVRERPRREEET